MGITRRTQGRSLSPAPPIPAEEGSDPRAANTRASARVGRGLAAGDVGSQRLRLLAGAAHHGLAPGAQAGPLGLLGLPREAAERATRALGAGGGIRGRGQEAGAGGCQLAQLAARVAAQSRWLAGRPPPPRRRLPRPGRGRSGRSPIHGLRLWARGAAAAAAPPAGSAGVLAPQETPGRGKSHRDGGWDAELAAARVPPARPADPRKSERAPRWGRAGGRAPGALGSTARSSQVPFPRALGSLTPFFPPSLPPATPLPPLCVFCLSPFLLSTQSYVIEVWMRNSQRQSKGTAARVRSVRSLPQEKHNHSGG